MKGWLSETGIYFYDKTDVKERIDEIHFWNWENKELFGLPTKMMFQCSVTGVEVLTRWDRQEKNL